MTTITFPIIPPRDYQIPLWRALDRGIKRAIICWHRRAGKDLACWNIMIKKAAFERVGMYWYVFPEFTQGRKALWEGFDKKGKRYIDYIPESLLAKKVSENSMKITFKNGSIIRVVGSDKPSSMRGPGPIGAVFSEYAFQRPGTWATVQPAMMENDGWAIFNSTPFGENHFFDLLQNAKARPEVWFSQVKSVLDTNIYTDAQIRQIAFDEGLDDDDIEREFYCSFQSSGRGAYFSRWLQDAKMQGRIAPLAWMPDKPVRTAWDIGFDDQTCIWFYQYHLGWIHVIDYYENRGKEAGHYVEYLKTRPYYYEKHYFPHDIAVHEWGTGLTRIETMVNLGLDRGAVDMIPRVSHKADSINAVREILPKCKFDSRRCETGLQALRMYRKKYNPNLKTFDDKPLHDWSSNASDAFQGLAMSFKGAKV